MPRFTMLSSIAVLMTVGSFASAQNFNRINEEADFRKMVVDKKLSSDMGQMTVKSNGKTEGVIFDKDFNANWIWKDGMYCRNAALGKQQLGTDCQVVRISGKSVQFIQKYGKGEIGTMELP